MLNKFNAITEKEYKTYKENFMKRFEITELPPYLILYIKVSIMLCYRLFNKKLLELWIIIYNLLHRGLQKIHSL